MRLDEKILIDDPIPRDPSHNIALNMRLNELVREGKYKVGVRIYKHNQGVILGNEESIIDVDEVYCREKGFEVIARKTGGSAVVVSPQSTLCYSIFINFPWEEYINLTKWYKRLVIPIVEQLRQRGLPATMEGVYYVRIGDGDKKIPFIGHAAAIHQEEKKKTFQLDGLVHLTRPNVEELQNILRLRRLYEYAGHKYLRAGDKIYPLRNGADVSAIQSFREEGSILLRDEKEELKEVLGLAEMDVSEGEFKEVLQSALSQAIGPLRRIEPDQVGYGPTNAIQEEVKGRPKGSRAGLGHCFIDLAEKEPKELDE